MELDLRHILRMARRWWWLLILAPLLAGLTAYWASSRQTPLYSASSTLVIDQASQSSQQQIQEIQANERLGATYQRLVDTDPILNAVIARLNLPFTADQMRDKVSAGAVTGTQLLRISASDTSPERAAAIANAIAQEFPSYLAQKSTQVSSSTRDAINARIADLDTQIRDITAQIQTLESGADANTPAVQSQISNLRLTLSNLQVMYGDALGLRQEMELNEAANQNRVTVWEEARVPSTPYAPRTTFYTALALFVGLLIAVGGIAVLEYLDNTVKTGLDFSALFGAPLLSVIGTVPKVRGGHDQLFISERSMSNPAEAVRLLRTNLEFAAASREISSLAVTSAGPGEGKSTVTANLAISMVQTGFTVAIVDADLRRPTQHRIFNVRNERGLTTLLTHPQQSWQWAAQRVHGDSLYLLPSGPLPPNPADLLSSNRFRELLAEMGKSVDIVIIDTPPVLAVTDPLVVATMTEAVMVVCRAGRTRIDALRRVVERLNQGTVRLVGVVLNQQTGRDASNYYYYYSGYYGSNDGGTPTSKPPALSAQPSSGQTKG